MVEVIFEVGRVRKIHMTNVLKYMELCSEAARRREQSLDARRMLHARDDLTWQDITRWLRARDLRRLRTAARKDQLGTLHNLLQRVDLWCCGAATGSSRSVVFARRGRAIAKQLRRGDSV